MPDQREPLWARSLADQPQSGFDDVVVRVLEDDPAEEEAAPPAGPTVPPARGRGRRIAVAGATALVLAGVALATEGDGSLVIDEVPSYWGEVPMRCDTVRLAQGEHAIEEFTCRAVGDRALPPGLYRSPESQWSSDITGRPARQSRIRITRDGDVTGWATY